MGSTDCKKNKNTALRYAGAPWMSEKYIPGLVSVIIPTYNRAHLLVDTLNSVLSQSYRPIEVIVVDDGSTDGTRSAIYNWQRDCVEKRNTVALKRKNKIQYPFQLHYIYQDNAGSQVARNRGLRYCSGEFIQMLDSDDLLAPNKLARQIALMENKQPGSIVYGPVRFFEPVAEGFAVYAPFLTAFGEQPLKQWVAGGFMPSHSFLWNRYDIYRLGTWDVSLTADQDGEYFMRFLTAGGRLILCENGWSYYRQSPNSVKAGNQISRQKNNQAILSRIRVTRKVEKYLEAHGLIDDGYRKALSHRYYSIAGNWSMTNNILRRYCLRHFKRHSPDGSAPGSQLNNATAKLLGPSIALFLRNIFQTRPGVFKHRPVKLVETAEQICAMDERMR